MEGSGNEVGSKMLGCRRFRARNTGTGLPTPGERCDGKNLLDGLCNKFAMLVGKPVVGGRLPRPNMPGAVGDSEGWFDKKEARAASFVVRGVEAMDDALVESRWRWIKLPSAVDGNPVGPVG